MPKINVYLPDALADAVKETGLPISAICQQALEIAARRVTDIRASATLGQLAAEDPAALLAHFTARARAAVRIAAEQARDAGAGEICTEHVLGGLLAEGTNLALRTLRSLDIEPADVLAALAAPAGGAQGQVPAPGAGTLERPPAQRVDAHAAAALELAAIEAFSLGQSYVGCEHILLGLIAEPDGTAGQVLRSLGADQRMTRRVIGAVLSGFVHARSQEAGHPHPHPHASPVPAPAQEPEPDASGLLQALQPLMQRLDRIDERLKVLSAPPA
jgi:ATP-dependent Clp protease ATP-binding subunit ClpA